MCTFSLFQAIVFRVAEGPFVEEFYQCVTHGFYTERWQEQAYTTLSLIFMFVMPLLILVSTYVSTVRTIASKYIFCLLLEVAMSKSYIVRRPVGHWGRIFLE